MAITRRGNVETRDSGGVANGGGGPGAHSGGGAGSTMNKGGSAGQAAAPAGNDASTGHAGVPDTHPISGTPLPKGTGAGEGTVITKKA